MKDCAARKPIDLVLCKIRIDVGNVESKTQKRHEEGEITTSYKGFPHDYNVQGSLHCNDSFSDALDVCGISCQRPLSWREAEEIDLNMF